MGRGAMPIERGQRRLHLMARRLQVETGIHRGGFLCQLLLGYTQSLLTQMARPPCAIATILLTNNCAVGCC